jgi:hypothetical protein
MISRPSTLNPDPQALNPEFQIPQQVVSRLLEMAILEQLLRRILKRFREGLVLNAHRLLYHSTLGSRVRNKTKKMTQFLAPKSVSWYNSNVVAPAKSASQDSGRVSRVCIYIYCTFIYVYIYRHIHIYIYAYIYIYIYAYIYIYMCIYIYMNNIYIYIYVYLYVYIQICIYR